MHSRQQHLISDRNAPATQIQLCRTGMMLQGQPEFLLVGMFMTKSCRASRLFPEMFSDCIRGGAHLADGFL